MNPARFKTFSAIARDLWQRDDPPPQARLERTDAVIFDVDGVLVEVSGSFCHVISRSAQFYFNRILGVPGKKRLVTSEETGFFKLAGDFNNDWDVTRGSVAFGLLKLLSLDGSADKSVADLRKGAPSLEEFTGEIKKRGGGLDKTLEMVREKLGEREYSKFEKLYKPDLIRRLFLEYYAGPELCRPLYGFEPEHYTGRGLIERERDIVDVPLLRMVSESGVALGILSGRIPSEADYLFRKTGLDRVLKPEFVVTDDGALPPKPDPAGLETLARKMNFTAALYVGDVPDDWATVNAYNSCPANEAPVTCCMVETGAVSSEMMSIFYEHSKVDYIAEDVNSLLRAILEARRV